MNLYSKKYSIPALQALNSNYNSDLIVTSMDVDIVNNAIDYISNTRTTLTPTIGDIVVYTDEYGNYYDNAHIEKVTDDSLYICEKPDEPFVNIINNRAIIHTSGGSWCTIPSNLKCLGVRDKLFFTWGEKGMRHKGAILFKTKVLCWEYNICKKPFTTQNYDVFSVYKSSDPIKTGFKYRVDKNNFYYKSFKTDEEYFRWVKIYNCVEDGINGLGNVKLWGYKEVQKFDTSKVEFDKIKDCIIDTELLNGKLYTVKKVVNGTIITTYFLKEY
ncbi:DUF4121 family protein (plasmid) [Clostridium perfringens]